MEDGRLVKTMAYPQLVQQVIVALLAFDGVGVAQVCEVRAAAWRPFKALDLSFACYRDGSPPLTYCGTTCLSLSKPRPSPNIAVQKLPSSSGIVSVRPAHRMGNSLRESSEMGGPVQAFCVSVYGKDITLTIRQISKCTQRALLTGKLTCKQAECFGANR